MGAEAAFPPPVPGLGGWLLADHGMGAGRALPQLEIPLWHTVWMLATGAGQRRGFPIGPATAATRQVLSRPQTGR